MDGGAIAMVSALRLSDLMNEEVSIHGRGNFPTLEVKLGRLTYRLVE